MGSPPISNPSLEIWKCLCFEFLWCCLGGCWKFLHQSKWSQYIFPLWYFRHLYEVVCVFSKRVSVLVDILAFVLRNISWKCKFTKSLFRNDFSALFRWRNGLKNVNTYYWLIWEEKNFLNWRRCMWKFLTLQTNPLGTIPLFCRKTEIGGARGKICKNVFQFTKKWWFGAFGKSLSRS